MEGDLEREDHVEVQEGVKMGSTTEHSWSMCGDVIDRQHEEPRLELDDPDGDTFPIPLKFVDLMRQT